MTDSLPPSIPALKPLSVSSRTRRWLILLLCVHAGVFFALCMPPHSIPGLWTIALLPLWLALDFTLRHNPANWIKRIGLCWLCTWPVGILYALLTADWVVHSAYVFGGLPQLLAGSVVWLGFGSFIAGSLWLTLALPFGLFWHRPALGLVGIPLWAIAIQQLSPIWFPWGPGQLMYTTPSLIQAQRWMGTEGLDVVFLGWQLWLYGTVRRMWTPAEIPLRPLLTLGFTVLVLLLLLTVDGRQALRPQRSQTNSPPAATLQLIGMQPNLSLARLASHPELLPAARLKSLTELVQESENAVRSTRLQAAEQTAPVNTELLVWPESVFGPQYFSHLPARRQVEALAKRLEVPMILNTLHTEFSSAEEEPRYYGSAVHVRADGSTVGRYDKITLMPFGETIPLGRLFPSWRRLFKRIVPQVSEFEAGQEYTVFRLTAAAVVAPLICFDILHRQAALEMGRAGANVGVVMANLAWFGDSGISRQMETLMRLRAIAAGIPMVLLSQNGESLAIDAQGRRLGEPLPAYTQGVLRARLELPEQASFYARHRVWWQRLALSSWAILMLWLYWKGAWAASRLAVWQKLKTAVMKACYKK